MMTMTFAWDPAQYLRFGGERGRPFYDLVGRVAAADPATVLDLGCGDGGFTTTLAARWPGAHIEGVDSSPEMIERARTHAGVAFSVADVREVTPRSDVDVLVSNALLQWVPEHRSILSAWAQAMSSGAWIAFQVPGNFDSPSHELMRALASTARWRPTLDGVLRHDIVGSPAEYAQLFLELGWSVDTWQTTYNHILAGEDAVLNWVRGTGLRPVLAALSDDDAREFEATYAELLGEAYPRQPWGTMFGFRRIFCVAHR
jgi:trans-aconitate 2-methyltransferase